MTLEKKQGLFTFFLTRERPANSALSADLVRPPSKPPPLEESMQRILESRKTVTEIPWNQSKPRS